MHKSAKPNRSVVVCLFVAWAIFSAGPRPVVHSHTDLAIQTLADLDEAIVRHIAMFHAAPKEEPSGFHFHWVFNPATVFLGQDGTLAVPLIQAPTDELSEGLGVDLGPSAAPYPWGRWCVSERDLFGELVQQKAASPQRIHSFLCNSVSIQEIFCIYRC